MAKLAQKQDDRPFREQLDDLEESIEMLKVAYERYFNGVDKIPPRREHEKIDRRVRMMMRAVPRTTAVRFRFNTLKARLVTYNQYWTRILRQIENGTFKRLMSEQARRDRERQMNAQAAREKLQREMDRAAAAEAESSGQPENADQAAAGVNGTRPAGPRRRPTTGPQKPASLPDGMSAGEARQLFKQFVQAKKAAGESTTGLTYGALVKKLAREMPKLKQKHGSNVAFEVATVEGKVRLRARRTTGGA